MEFRNRAIVPSMVGALCMVATSTLAQVGEIPERYGPSDNGHEMMWGGS